MNSRMIIAAVAVAVAAGGYAKGSKPVQSGPVELSAVARIESRTADKNRDPGIFGDYWWANRFLSRHQEIERINGKPVDVVLVLDADPAYTNTFRHRVNGTDGDITVKSGVFHIAGENTQFPNVPKISVEENGAFVFSSSYTGKALPSVTNLTLAGSSRFEIINDTTGKHHLPFTQNQLNLTLDADSTFRLMDDLCLTVQTFRVGNTYQHKGTYTSSKCPAIKSGTVVVLSGPPRGILFTVR